MACSLNMAPKPNLRISTPTSFSAHNVKPLSHSVTHTLQTPKPKDVLTSASSSSSSSSSSTCNATEPIPKKRQRVVASVLAPPLSTSAIETASYSSISLSLSHFWREIQGCNDWEDLLDPLHPLLRDEIIRYGEFVSACYEAFDLDPNSKRYLNCKHGKKSLLREVGLEDSGYEVTKYIYATPDVNLPLGDSCGRWIGYVAVSNDDEVKKIGRRDVVITFRGTVTNPEWMANLMSSLTPARLDPQNPRPDVKVESGFLNLYTADESTNCKFGVKSCREQLLSEVSRLLSKYKGEEMSITLAGHSMGSSLALLFAYDISELGLLNRNISISTTTSTNNNSDSSHRDDKIPVTVFSFGGPRVGNSAFKERCEELGVKVLRIVNVNDPITKVPGVFFNENFRVLGGRYEFPWSCSCYAHVGAELVLDFFNVQNPSCVHDIEFYINLLKHPNMKSSSTVIQRNFDNLVQRAREFVLMSAQNFDMLQWRNAADNVMNLIPTQRSTTIY